MSFAPIVIDDFLSRDDVDFMNEFYSKIGFQAMQSDLYQFQQSHEIFDYMESKYFLGHIEKIFNENYTTHRRIFGSKNIIRDNDNYLSLFASKYETGSYLLPHDDLIETRIYTYIYYLNEAEGGELKIFNEDMRTVRDTIQSKANRLVIFEVSHLSLHEVSMVFSGERKAFTGWYNLSKENYAKYVALKKINFNYAHSLIPPKENFEMSDQPIIYQLKYNEQHDITCCSFPLIFDYDKSNLLGPCIYKRITAIKLLQDFMPRIPGYKLISHNFYSVEKSDYILVDSKMEEDLLDIFMISSKYQLKENENIPIIYYIDVESGTVHHELRLEEEICYLVQRKKYKWYLDVAMDEFYFAHFSMKKIK